MFKSLPRRHKRLLMLLSDAVALPLALWSAFALRLQSWWPADSLTAAWWIFLLVSVTGVALFHALGLYRAVVRFMGPQVVVSIALGVATLALLQWSAAYVSGTPFPRTVPVIFALVALFYVGGSRLLVRWLYQWSGYGGGSTTASPVVIYGAGHSGAQLASLLTTSNRFRVTAFVDDDPTLQGSTVFSTRVYPPDALPELIKRHAIDRILLAIPSATRTQRRHILQQIESLPVEILTVPGIEALVSGRASLDQLRAVEVEDLLGREPVPPDPALLGASITGKVVLVTGAGGSIGAELCRQIVALQPRTLLLYEISEFALYAIEQTLTEELRGLPVQLVPLLGSVTDRARVERVIDHFGVQTIYHAAAYKHVPLVEQNLFEGIRNNALGTRAVAEAAAAAGVERFILISTDKAVRPTNVMGATKRLAELILQALAQTGSTTCFSMVRFGNVLDSSGSVVPRFRQQIRDGGPVTVTHPEITRYFMTIPEAAQLVIQAGAMAQGGDVFVLDMGEPVRIAELARHMIHLSGLEVRDEAHPEGDIAITYTGLRPGEKLYEELLIGDNVVGTAHPRILRAEERTLPAETLAALLDQLEQAHQACDSQRARDLLQRAVEGYTPSNPAPDWLATRPHPEKSGTLASPLIH